MSDTPDNTISGKSELLGRLENTRRDLLKERQKVAELQRLLKEPRSDLEEKIKQRTHELEDINERLLQEISKREKAQEDLISGAITVSSLLDAARDYIFVKDANLRFTEVNAATIELFGLPIEKIVGKTLEEIRGIEAHSNIAETDRRVIKGQTVETEHSFTLSGRRLYFSAIKTPITDESGQVIGLCGIARDITERKELNKSSHTRLEKFVSSCFRETIKQISLVANSDSNSLLLGESGVGKDYLAKYIHDHSKRCSGPFFFLNCAVLTESLAESELFGHEAGAFTGAVGKKRGLLELADGGTLLLNEVGELPPPLQAKLLSFLDSQAFTRVGGEKHVIVNTRILAATNKDLPKDAMEGIFRADLYYRLNVFTITIPPLRDRLEDLPILVDDLVSFMSRKLALPRTASVEPSAMKRLMGYSWPGNIRELKNVLERAIILSRGSKIRESNLGLLSTGDNQIPHTSYAFDSSFHCEEQSLPEAILRFKRHMLEQALRKSAGNVTKAAAYLGISRDTMKHLMKSLELDRSNFKRSSYRMDK